jgi:hypothetical protein
VSAYINCIINVAWRFGHGILLDPEASILRPFQPVLQGEPASPYAIMPRAYPYREDVENDAECAGPPTKVCPTKISLHVLGVVVSMPC